MSHLDLATAIYFRHRRAVFGYLARAVASTDRAEDLCQEVFLRVVRGLRGYRDTGTEAAWVFRIARGVLADAMTSGPPAAAAAGLGEGSDDPQPPIQAIRMSLTEALAELSPLNRDLLLLREVGGLSHAEIAAATGLTAAGVKCRLGRTREWLQANVLYERRSWTPARRRGEDDED